jgi:hypothetical protein
MTMYVHVFFLLYVAYAGTIWLPNPSYLQDAVDNQDGHGGSEGIK